ncbi:hypothetical protein DPEC_G00318770 [Dallia pectoralis]|uniref:Uncharacterized protein n=1 Tax=Dallia pectoralis TaxID=75939 RepID=A0ACC2F9E7_DALPE|nr:hypothetical protein DPEC_G00318770 [Dallia pectoralis]
MMFINIYFYFSFNLYSTSMIFRFWTVVIPSFLTVHCLVPDRRERGYDLCVTSGRGIKDLSNQNLSSVPPHLPDITEYLDISFNNIHRLDDESLAGLSHLCFLKATHCGLRFISPRAFLNASGIKVLNFSQNSFSIIPDLTLPQLRILDLTGNLYDSYQLPSTFQKLTLLEFFFLGSGNACSVKNNDFAALRNISVKQFGLSAGTGWLNYESGSLTNLKSLQEMTLNVPFCKNFDIFKNFLMDLNKTQTTILRLVKFFPDKCIVPGDPFETLKSMHLVTNLTVVDTWLNSSVMVKLWKNAWVSNIQQLMFINITYNEDTPDGFKLIGQNSSVHLRAIIFNHVTHYQYKYPLVNLSTDALRQMTYLKVSGTGMNISPCNLISAFPSLETLDLSNNLLDDLGFWWPSCSYTSVFPALRFLNLSQNRFRSLAFISDKTHQMRTLQSLDLSFNSIHIGEWCSWPSNLREINLSNNNMGNTVFRFLSPHFERIDLSKTGITALDPNVLLEFPRLTHLFLSSNSIKVLPVDLRAPTLHVLHVDQNIIFTFSMATFEGLSHLRTLKAGNNPFSCSCSSYWFVTTLNKSLLPDWPLDYTCSVPPPLAGLSMADYKPGKLSCELWLQAAIALSTTFAVTTALGLTFYACDGVWYTKMLWVWILMKRRGKRKIDRLRDRSFIYHAFISYSQQDSSWVDSQLVSTLEGAGLSLCIHERDFVPGEWVIDNIMNCVEASYKTLFVLSNNFVQSDWCNYELFFAYQRGISVQQDSLVFLLLEPIPLDSLPKKFLNLRGLLRQQTYLKWPGDGPGEETKRQVFWSSLRAMLGEADNSMWKPGKNRQALLCHCPPALHFLSVSARCPRMSCSPEVKDVDPMECPLCLEPLEIDDVNFFPCTCGYQICRFCWHRIRTDENGLCPACRKPYPEDPAVYKPLSAEELQRIRNEKKAKQVEKKQKVSENRKHLASVRVVQRNLVFVVGLSQRLADPEVLKRPEYFGKFGKIHKVVINNSTSYAGSQGPSASAYVTYLRSEDALRAIQSVNNVMVDGRTLKASLGTTKYCSYFLKNMQCPKPDCMYLHELGDEAASFTKEEMQAGKHQEYEQKLLQDLYKNPVFTTQASGGEKTKSKNSSLQRSNSNSSHGQEAWPSLQPTGKTANGLSSEHHKSPPLDGGGSDSEHMISDGPEFDIGLGSGSALSPFSSSCDPSSDVLPDVISSSIAQHGIIGNGETSENHNLLPDCDSPSPPPVHAGPPGFSKPSLMVPISVACLTARSPFEGASAESQSLFSDNSNFRHPNPIPNTSSRTPQHQDHWPTAPEPHSLFTSDTIPVSSSTDWQAAFGFGSSKQQTSEDDLGFDPFDITRKALADLIEKELSVQDSLPALSPFHPHHTALKPGCGPPGGLISSHHNLFSGMNSDFSRNHSFSPMHQHQHPQNRASYSTFSFSGQPSSSTSLSTSNATSRHPWMTSSAAVGSAPSRNTFTTHFGNHTTSNHTTVTQHSSFLDLVLPSMSSIQRHNTGLGDITMTAGGAGGTGGVEQHIHIKEWQDGLRALLPNININFDGLPPNSSSSSSSSSPSSVHHTGLPMRSSGPGSRSGLSSGGPGGVSHSLSWDGSFGTASWMDPAIITGIPSSGNPSMDSLHDDNPPHWLKSLQALTEMDVAPLPSSTSSPQQPNPHGSHGAGPFGGSQYPLQNRPSWAPYIPAPPVPHSHPPASQFHSPPPGFQTALRAPVQTAPELLQSAGMDRH